MDSAFRYLNYVYPLRPTKAQHRALEHISEQQRQLYNAALQERIDAWRKGRISISYVDQCKSLTLIRADGLDAVPVNLQRGTLARIDRAFQAFYRRAKAGQTPGFPRFKPRTRWSGFAFKEASGLRVLDAGKRLRFVGVPGAVRIHQHRPLPAGSVVKSATFSQAGNGWQVALQLAIPVSESSWADIRSDQRPDAGIDLGVNTWAMLSQGIGLSSPPEPDWAQRRRLQRSLARKHKGSRARMVVRKQLAALQRHEANTRKHHAHVESHRLAMTYRCIVVEDLQVANMTRSASGSLEAPGRNVSAKSGLNRSMLSQGWSDFVNKLVYKAEDAGGLVIKVKPNHTSQDCSSCGERVPKALHVRTHRCKHCGLVLDRDHNAALNILFRAAREDKLPGRHESPRCHAEMAPETIIEASCA